MYQENQEEYIRIRILKMYQENQEESISIQDTLDVSGESRRIYKYQGYSRCIRRIKKKL